MAFPAVAPAGENYARSGLPVSAPNLPRAGFREQSAKLEP